MEVEEKWCGRCEILLPTSEFTKSSSSPDGLWYVCRGCRSEMRRSHKKKDPRQVKDAFLQWRYGITIERSIIADAISYDEMHSPRALPKVLSDRMKVVLGGS
jgi:hypothetical protein